MASVLIVDDDPRIRELLCRWLGPEGHALRFSENANAALIAIGEASAVLWAEAAAKAQGRRLGGDRPRLPAANE